MKYFHELDKKAQNNLRREYKNKFPQEYNYSIKLYILYVIIGIITVFSLLLMIFISFKLGLSLFIIGFITLIIIINFLNKSNKPFYDFLTLKGYKNKKK